jgi:hypothetical protein
MVAVLADVLVFAVKVQVIVPVSVPLVPEVIESQVPPDVTAAVHGMVPVPVPVLETMNVVVPASLSILWLVGEITKCPNDPGCPPRTARTYKLPLLPSKLLEPS